MAETTGIVYRDSEIELASNSPKLSTSIPTADTDPQGDGEWTGRYDDRRVDALASVIEAYPFQLKFVITDQSDIVEINQLIERLRDATATRIRDIDAVLIPEGATRERLDKTRVLTADLSLEYGYRYTARLHVDLWNDVPRT